MAVEIEVAVHAACISHRVVERKHPPWEDMKNIEDREDIVVDPLASNIKNTMERSSG